MKKAVARPFTGDDETVGIAQIALTQAATLQALRQAQAVLLPLLHGMGLAQTAQVIGVLLGWACQLCRHFIAGCLVGAVGAHVGEHQHHAFEP